MKIVLPVEETENFFIPRGFEQFLTCFWVLRPNGLLDMRYFVQHPDNDTSYGRFFIEHEDEYDRYDRHRETVLTSMRRQAKRHLVLMSDDLTESSILVRDARRLAESFAEAQETLQFQQGLFVSLDKWVQDVHNVQDQVERRCYVNILQKILFPYYIRKRMLDTFRASPSLEHSMGAVKIYEQGSWYPNDIEVHHQIVLREFSVDE